MKRHLAVFSTKEDIDKIFSLEKTVDFRFGSSRQAPYGEISKGDIIQMKASGEKILGEAEVDNVLFHDNLDAEALGKLRREYFREAAMDEKYWSAQVGKKFVSIVFLKKPKRYLSALKSTKKDRRGWVVK